MTEFVTLDAWFKDRLVDPLSKRPLARDASGIWRSADGTPYPEQNGIPDLRGLRFVTSSPLDMAWRRGQAEYEAWARTLRETVDEHRAGLEGVRPVYEQLRITGSCLDVGGHQGRLRYFLDPRIQYAIVDPFIDVFDGLADDDALLTAYPQLRRPVNFICGLAELLPVASATFEWVHMRSVLDHLFSAELALREAWRVLQSDGQLVVGTFVEGGRTGVVTAREQIRGRFSRLRGVVLPQLADHHIWHPSYRDLEQLLGATGFDIAQTVWQASTDDHVVYVVARKRQRM